MEDTKMYGLLVSLLLLAYTGPATGQQCPPNYELAGNGKCVQVFSEPQTRDAAAATCQSRNAELLTIRNPSEQTDMKWILQSRSDNLDYLWTSGEESIGSWQGIGGNIYLGCYYKEQRSAEVPNPATKYNLWIYNLTAVTPNLCVDTCRQWLKTDIENGVAYVTINHQTNEAQCYCSQQKAALRDESAASCLTPCPRDSSVSCGGYSYYVGYKLKQGQTNWWNQYDPLSLGTPNGGESINHCLAAGYGQEFKWIAKPCYTKMRSICQLPLSMTDCTVQDSQNAWYNPQTGQPFCYRVNNTPMNWYQANSYCESQRGSLVKPQVDTDRSWAAVLNSLGQFRAPYSYDIWMGSTRSRFSWSNGDPITNFGNFSENRPATNKGSCIGLSAQASKPYSWDSLRCTAAHPFVCQRAATIIPTTPSTTTSTTTTTTTTTVPTTTTTTVPTTTTTTVPTTTTTTTTTTSPTTTFASASTAPPVVPGTPVPIMPGTPVPIMPGTPVPIMPGTPVPITPFPITPATTPKPIPSVATPPQPSLPPVIPPSPGISAKPVTTKATTTGRPLTSGKPVIATSGKPGKQPTTRNPNAFSPVFGMNGIMLTTGTYTVIGIVSGIVLISIVILTVFCCQRRRKESLEEITAEERQSKQESYIENYNNTGFENSDSYEEPADYTTTIEPSDKDDSLDRDANNIIYAY